MSAGSILKTAALAYEMGSEEPECLQWVIVERDAESCHGLIRGVLCLQRQDRKVIVSSRYVS